MDTLSKQTIQPTPPQQEMTSVPSYSHHSSSRRPSLMYVFIVLMLMGGLAVGLVALNSSQDVRSRASNDGPTLMLSPAVTTQEIGKTFTVGLIMNTRADSVSAAELHLSYDPTAIQIERFAHGTTLPVVLVPETHANGTIAVTLAAKPPTPFKGAGIVGIWTVKILAAKQSSIQFTAQTSVAALGKMTNALTAQTGCTITGSAGNVPIALTPTPVERLRFKR